MSSDLISRLRALADEHKHPLVAWEQRLVATLLEAADALEAEETRRMMLNTSNGEWSKRFHALEQERDAVKSKLVEAEKVNSAMDMIKSSIESGTLLDAITRAKQERDAARAEAADFRELLKEMRDLADKDGYLSRILSVKVIDQALSQPGPGAALLERVKKLEALAAEVRRYHELLSPSEQSDECVTTIDVMLAALEEKP